MRRTHYDTLEVGRDATPEAIAAAYRMLSKRHHPDRNGGDADRMAELNAAFAVLDDPGLRRDYDRVLAARAASRGVALDAPPLRFAPPRRSVRRELLWWLAGGVGAAALALALIALTLRADPPSPPPAAPSPAAPASAPGAARPVPLPPLAAAPARPAAYLDAASANDGGGRSRLAFDNAAGTVAVEVELVPLSPNGARRRAYIPAGGAFAMERVRGGRYRLRFHDLGDGSRSTGAPFQLGGGGRPGDLTVKLSRE